MTKRQTVPYCPKCGNNSLLLHEIWSQPAIIFWQIDGNIDPEGSLGQPDAAEKVLAECEKCRHSWTLRGVRTVQDLPNWPEVRVD